MPAGQPTMLENIFPFVIIFIVMYFFYLRPSAKKASAHEKFVQSLKRGDEVVTTSGVYGVVDSTNENFVTLEIASNVKMKVLKRNIGSTLEEAVKKQTSISSSGSKDSGASTSSKKV